MRIKALTAALLTANLATAATPIDGWYSSLFGGYAYLPDNVSNTRLGLTRADAVYEGGFDAGGSIGYKSNPLRYEGELTYINAKIDHFRINNTRQIAPRGYATSILAMANVYYDFPGILAASIEPFLGIGLGYGWVKAELDSSGPSGPTRFTGENSVFAYQATAGLTYNFAENYALTLGYRYVATEEVHDLGKVFQAHLANVGVVYRFCENRYK
ncbi:outer membrane protein [Legionella londiniensis]|uniref:Opacity protein-like surface antigen n=1 Tax=Legionella londiniensis TaxID=45068 RepID=A0A0W0VL14_9GAMM|nr:outer membrane beta-barrel protein [Legionella londiniensis]KTD20739.1 opacity protein-like surface antigen [Legionella londiniensis]STX92788.1 opacity protein-like surface antigen [Legionella londiniensis]